MSKRVKRKKTTDYLTNSYDLRSKSKSKRLKSDDKYNSNQEIVIKSQKCVNLSVINAINVSNVIQTTPKLTKMPNKYYNLRRRPVAVDDSTGRKTRRPVSRLTINDLPDDCLLDIFERLPTIRDKCCVQTVNKRFCDLINRLMRAQKAFTVVTTYGEHKEDEVLTKSMFMSVIQKCPNLRVFKMPGFYAKDNRENTGVNDRIGSKEICSLANNCPDLRELDICGCGNVGEKGVNHLVTECSKLEKLAISFCHSVTGLCLKKLTKHFKALSLNVNDLSPPLIEALRSLNEGNGRYLTELNVYAYNQIENTESILQLIANNFLHLRCLRYSLPSKDKPNFGIFGKMSNLTHLAFDFRPFNLNDQQFIQIMSGCPHLKSLFIRCDLTEDTKNPITDYSVRKLPLLCPQVERLYFNTKGSSYKLVTDSSVINFSQFTQLKELSFKSFENIGDSVIAVIKCCPKLVSISLLNSLRVSNATIDALIVAAKSNANKKIKFDISGPNLKVIRKKIPQNLINCSINQ